MYTSWAFNNAMFTHFLGARRASLLLLLPLPSRLSLLFSLCGASLALTRAPPRALTPNDGARLPAVV